MGHPVTLSNIVATQSDVPAAIEAGYKLHAFNAYIRPVLHVVNINN